MTIDVKMIKLVCGDTIICEVERYNDYVIAIDPLLLYTAPTQQGTLQQVMLPWMEGALAREFNIPEYHIIAIVTADDYITEMYQRFIDNRKFSYAEQEILDKQILTTDTSNSIH